jgi:CAAX protease family protein
MDADVGRALIRARFDTSALTRPPRTRCDGQRAPRAARDVERKRPRLSVPSTSCAVLRCGKIPDDLRHETARSSEGRDWQPGPDPLVASTGSGAGPARDGRCARVGARRDRLSTPLKQIMCIMHARAPVTARRRDAGRRADRLADGTVTIRPLRGREASFSRIGNPRGNSRRASCVYTTVPQPPDPQRRALLTFFAIVFGATWLLQLPAILVQRGYLAGPIDRYVALVVLGYFVPTIAALVLSLRALGGGGVRALLRPFGAWRVAPRWYGLALAHPAVILFVGMSVARLVTGSHIGSASFPPTAAAQVAAMLVIPFTEQIPWRGFAYLPLERLFGPLGASLLAGATWALFHLQKQLLIGPGLAFGVAVWTLLLMTAGTVVYTWFYRRTGSMLLVVIANAGIYLNNSTQALPANAEPLAIHALGYCAVAMGLVLVDRCVWRVSALPVGVPLAHRARNPGRVSGT